MQTKNIQLINAEEVSFLFQTKYNNSSFIRVLSGEEQINLATAISSANEIVQGEQLEIKIGESYLIELDDFSSEIELELKNLGWGLILFINGEAYYLRVNTKAQESEFEAIKNYPSLRIVDFGSSKNEAIKNLDCLIDLKQLQSLNVDNCYSLVELKGLHQLTTLETLFLDDFNIESEYHHLTCLKSLRNFSQKRSVIKNVNHLKELKSLNNLNLYNCTSLSSLEDISCLTNLTSLNLYECISLTSLEGISCLTNLTSLNLSYCGSLTSIEAISALTNLSSLNLTSSRTLTSLKVISGLTNLISLNLTNCPLKSLEGISGLTNLTSLDLSGCSSLKNIEAISGLTYLTSLNLDICSSLTSLEGISSLSNLVSLNLSGCSSLKSLQGISGLSNLTSLDLDYCESLTNLSDISSLSNLVSLNLCGCSSLKSLQGISGLSNLTSLNLGYCESLTNLSDISSLSNLISLDLTDCKSLIFIKKLKSLSKLSKLELRDCGNIRDFEELIHCPKLKKVTWVHEASCSYVLTGSAVRRGDSLFIEEKIKGWVNDLQFSKNPIAIANELITAVGLIENQSLAKEQLIHLANLMRERGLADGESGNAFNTTNWELWLEAVMRKGDAFQEILDLTTQNINPERELEVFTAPILTALADITMLYPSAKEWAINFVMELVAPFKENEDWARTIAPAAAVFYAGMELQEEVTFWLNKGTHPHIPKWKDTILLALTTYYTQKADYTNSRKYLKNITLPHVQDQGRVLIAKAMCVDFPQEALEEFLAIKDVVLQTALAKQLALESSILASSEGLYQILLCLEQTPALFSEFVVNVLEKQPSSRFVQCIEALFAQPIEKSSSATAFLALCNEPTVIENIGKLNLQEFKNELQEEVNKERVSLVKDFVSTLIEKELINEKFREKFQHDLTTNL